MCWEPHLWQPIFYTQGISDITIQEDYYTYKSLYLQLLNLSVVSCVPAAESMALSDKLSPLSAGA